MPVTSECNGMHSLYGARVMETHLIMAKGVRYYYHCRSFNPNLRYNTLIMKALGSAGRKKQVSLNMTDISASWILPNF